MPTPIFLTMIIIGSAASSNNPRSGSAQQTLGRLHEGNGGLITTTYSTGIALLNHIEAESVADSPHVRMLVTQPGSAEEDVPMIIHFRFNGRYKPIRNANSLGSTKGVEVTKRGTLSMHDPEAAEDLEIETEFTSMDVEYTETGASRSLISVKFITRTGQVIMKPMPVGSSTVNLSQPRASTGIALLNHIEVESVADSPHVRMLVTQPGSAGEDVPMIIHFRFNGGYNPIRNANSLGSTKEIKVTEGGTLSMHDPEAAEYLGQETEFTSIDVEYTETGTSKSLMSLKFMTQTGQVIAKPMPLGPRRGLGTSVMANPKNIPMMPANALGTTIGSQDIDAPVLLAHIQSKSTSMSPPEVMKIMQGAEGSNRLRFVRLQITDAYTFAVQKVEDPSGKEVEELRVDHAGNLFMSQRRVDGVGQPIPFTQMTMRYGGGRTGVVATFKTNSGDTIILETYTGNQY